jgi:hypothetical protein
MLKIPWMAIAIEKKCDDFIHKAADEQMKTKAHDLATHFVP